MKTIAAAFALVLLPVLVTGCTTQPQSGSSFLLELRTSHFHCQDITRDLTLKGSFQAFTCQSLEGATTTKPSLRVSVFFNRTKSASSLMLKNLADTGGPTSRAKDEPALIGDYFFALGPRSALQALQQAVGGTIKPVIVK